jgi:PAS domain S-box-containing protein
MEEGLSDRPCVAESELTNFYEGRFLMRTVVEQLNCGIRPPPENVWAFADGQLIRDLDEAGALAQAIVDTTSDPLLVLDQKLRVVAANRAFYLTFGMDRQDVRGCPIYVLGDGEWNVPDLRLLLGGVGCRGAILEEYEVERDFPVIGRRLMLLHAREVFKQKNAERLIVLTIKDITDRRDAERETAKLLQKKETLLQEMQHRVANSLHIIASILLLKARTVQSEETRLHLREAHQRVMSVATVQQQLQSSGQDEPIEVGPYLSRLCNTLAASVIADSQPISLKVKAGAGIAVSVDAVSIGLITVELVINALKHGFPDGKGGEILVKYDADGSNWRLAVSDNGVGSHRNGGESGHSGLGTSIVEALAHQLNAGIEITSGLPGLVVSVIHTS